MTEPPAKPLMIDARTLRRSGTKWNIVLQLIAKLQIGVVTVLAAMRLPQETFGTFFTAVAAAYVLGGLWDAGIGGLCSREIAAKELSIRGAMHLVVNTRILLLPAFMPMVVAMALHGQWSDLLGWPALITLIVAGAAWSIGGVALAGALIGSGDFRALGLGSAAGRLLSFLPLAGLMTTSSTHGRTTLLAASLASSELFTLLLYGRHLVLVGRKDRDPKIPWSARAAIRRAAPYAGSSMLGLAYARGDVLLVSGLAGTLVAATYAPSSQLQNIMLAIPAAVSAGLVTSVATNNRNQFLLVSQAVGTSVRNGLKLAIPVGATLFALAPHAVSATLGPAFGGTIWPVRIMAADLVFLCILYPLIQGLIAIGHALASTSILAMTFVISVVLHLLLDRRFGATGGAVASAMRDPLAVAMAYYSFRRYLADPVQHDG